MDKQNNQQTTEHAQIFTIYHQTTTAPPFAIYEPSGKRANNRRRFYFTILSIVCAIISALLFALAIALVVTLVINVELHSPGVDFNKLEENETVDEWTTDDCGRAFYTASVFPGVLKNSGRIINGAEAVNHSFPWLVSLRRMNKHLILEHFCAGSIIGEDTILTAAHCIHPDEVNYKEVVVVTGLHHRIDDIKYKSQVYSIENVKIDFDPLFIYEKDYALLKLTRKIQMSKKASPICLSKTPNNYSALVGKQLLTIGWGDTSGSYKIVLADRLQQSMRRVIDDRFTCSISGLVTWKRDSTLCTISTSYFIDESVCMGDSGGPLMSYESSSNRWYIEGITSYVIVMNDNGQKRCEIVEPNFFTFVAKYRDVFKNFLSDIL